MILDKIVKAKRQRLNKITLEERDRVKEEALNLPASKHLFLKSLKEEGISIIGELKKASPSKGLILPDFENKYEEIARIYEKTGIRAISVLTEEDFFQGKNDFLVQIKNTVSLPVLRKDFVIDPYQIYESKCLGADAILLIVRILTDEELASFFTIADSLGLDVLFEAHDEEEVKRGVKAGARILGINNRDLDTFEVDIKRSEVLYPLIPQDCVKVSESGIFKGTETDYLYRKGFDACLIGECLMRSTDLEKDIKELLGK